MQSDNQLSFSQTDDLEYFVPAPVLIHSEKVFNFGLASFSMLEFLEMLGVIALCFGLWQLLAFLPLIVKLILSTSLVLLGFLFITQPVNGLPGDTWLRYSLQHYLLQRRKNHLARRGRSFIRLKRLSIVDTETGQTLIEAQLDHSEKETVYGFL